jgi:hypothetical protein
LQAKGDAASCKTEWTNKDYGKLEPESPLNREKKLAAAVQKRYVLPVSYIAF